LKVLLVNTNTMTPPIAPIGLDYVADALIDAGHEPALLDLCFSESAEQDIAGSLMESQLRAVCLTIRNTDDCYFHGGSYFIPGIGRCVDQIRQYSEAPIVIGGVGFSIFPEAVMEAVGADFGIAGEGEDALPALLSALEKGETPGNVANLIHRRNGELIRNPVRFTDLSRHSRRRRFIDNARYFREGGQAGIEMKRGCDMGCFYCADPVAKGNRVRMRPPALVVDELRRLLDQGIDHFHTCDPEFNVPGEHAVGVCEAIIAAGLGERLRWYAYCSVTPFDREMADIFKKAGCAGIDFGADSGSREMLKRLGRAFTPEDIETAAEACHASRIPFMFDLLMDSPGETTDSVRESIDLMKRVGADCVGLSIGVRVYEGTPMARYVRELGECERSLHLRGAVESNPGFLRPVYFSELGDEITDVIRERVAGDSRFFLPMPSDGNADYNYNDNSVLVEAIRSGERGAYWDILRRLSLR